MKRSNSESRHTLTLPEYKRIFGTIYSILEGRADLPHACLFFASAGALILNKYYKIPARAVGGTFMVCADSDQSLIVFGKMVDGILESSNDAFHFWVQTEYHIIDFMAPIYGDSANSFGAIKHVSRNMFYKEILSEANSPNDVVARGDYFTNPNLELTEELIDNFLIHQESTDLLQACDQWFKKHPKKMKGISFLDDAGTIHKVQYKFPVIRGVW